MTKIDLINIFGEYSPSDITILDIIKDFVECNGCVNPIGGDLVLNYLYNDLYTLTRNTMDIDYHFCKKSEWDSFKNSCTKIASNNSKLGVKYYIVKEKCNPNGESLTIEFLSKELNGKFKIDMNFGSYCKTINLGNVILYSPEMIIADKLSVLCSQKIQRRCKDLYDIFLIAKYEEFNLYKLCNEIKKKLDSRDIGLGMLSLLNPNILINLEKGYRKIKLMDMPTFEEVCKVDLKFILNILSRLDGINIPDLMWSSKTLSWNTGNIYGHRLSTDLFGTICKETASGMLGLSTFPPYPVLVENEFIDLNMDLVRFITKDYSTTDRVKLTDNLYITSFEKTIVDMLEDGEYRILMESLESYKDEYGTLDKLKEVAKQYNKEEILQSYLIELINNQ